MKILDFFIYVLYTGTPQRGSRGKSQAQSALYYFCFALSTFCAMAVTIAIFSIDPYWHFLFRVLPRGVVTFIGFAQLLLTGYFIYSWLKKHYTEERVLQISEEKNGLMGKGGAVALYVLIFLVHICFVVYWLIPMIGLFAGHKQRWNF